MRYYRTLLVLLILALLGFLWPLPAATQTPSAATVEPDSDEIAVMTVVLDAAHAFASPGWVLVSARTATFECSPPADIGINIGGCSGMRAATEMGVRSFIVAFLFSVNSLDDAATPT